MSRPSASGGQRSTVSLTVGLLDVDRGVREIVLIGRAERTPERVLSVGRRGRSCGLGRRAPVTPPGASVMVWAGVRHRSWCRAGCAWERCRCAVVPAAVAVDAHTPGRPPGRRSATNEHDLPQSTGSRGGEGLGVRIPVAIAPSSQHRAGCGRLCAFSSAEPGPPGTHLQWRQRVGREAPGSAPLSRIPGVRTSHSPSYKRSMAVQPPP